MGYLKSLFPLLQASFCLRTNKFSGDFKTINEPEYFFTTTKVQKISEEPSIKATQDVIERQEHNQQEYIKELNKTNIYLLVTTKTTKEQEKLLLLLEPEDRLNSEKLLVEERHKTMVAKALDNPEPQKDSNKAKEKSEFIANRLQSRIKDTEALEKTLNFIERGKDIRKKKSLFLYKDIDGSNPLGKIGTNLALRTPFLEINAKTGQLKNKEQRFMTGRTRSIKIYSQLKNSKLNKQFSSELKFLRDNQSYYVENRSSLKSICPVFLDKQSAEDFLIQNTKLSLSPLEHKRNLLKIYNKLLKSEESFAMEVLGKTKKSEESIEKDSYSVVLRKTLDKLKFLRQKDDDLTSKNVLEEHQSILPAIRRTLHLYRKEINSLKEFSTKKNKPFGKNLHQVPTEVNATKVISLGLGDFVQYYSSSSQNKSLERVEFLFFPKAVETENLNPVKNFFTKEKSTEKANNFITNFDLKGKTFKDYQKEYFMKKNLPS